MQEIIEEETMKHDGDASPPTAGHSLSYITQSDEDLLLDPDEQELDHLLEENSDNCQFISDGNVAALGTIIEDDKENDTSGEQARVSAISEPTPETSWLHRLQNNYDRQVLTIIALQILNEGLILLRIYSMKDIYKSNYGVEPSQM